MLCSLVSCGGAVGGSGLAQDGVEAFESRIFVSSKTYNGDLGGLSGADQKCLELARAAGLSRNYKAILSDEKTLARDRLQLNGAIYVFDRQANKRMVAVMGKDLWGSDLLESVERDERGNPVAGLAWTGSDSDGGNFGGALANCGGWSSSSSGEEGSVGGVSYLDGRWIESMTPAGCDEFHRIYCISQ